MIPLVPGGKAFTARLSITRDLDYAIVARTEDGRKLPKNGYHIDARADYPPRVGFDEPEEALEVHPIAEVLNRIRVADDFGLSKAGIVYRVNDGDEKTLVARDFTAPSAKPQTGSKLEEMLALEALALTPTDSVTYYAFAEDNFPGGSRRTETDLRYIDIRPFKRTYQLADEGGDEDLGESTTLAELIARQRFNLNRTVRLAKHRPGDRTTPEDPLKIASFEELLAALTREVLDGFQAAVGDRFESLQQAEAAMVAAVNALDREKNDDASALEADALRHLIEARRTFRFLVGNGDTGQAMMRDLRSFDRKQAQKIRKPKNQAEEAEALVAEIEELAGDEDFVYATIAQFPEDSGVLPLKPEPVLEPPEPKIGQAQADQTGQESRDLAKEGGPKQTGPTAARGKSGTRKAAGTGKQPVNKDPESEQARVAGAESSMPRQPQTGASKTMDHRAITAEQGRITDLARDLEERLKRLEPASELSKLRMAKAAESAECASGALIRGRSKEAAGLTRSGAMLLHEVARQVKGEIAREVADAVAMARDRAEELAKREAEFAEMPPTAGASDSESRGSQSAGSEKDMKAGARGKETDAEMLERLAEEARTLEQWLKQIAGRGEGKAGEMARELLEQGKIDRDHPADRSDPEMHEAGKSDEARGEAAKVAQALEAIARSLDMLHRDIVAPRLAALVEAEKRLAELSDRARIPSRPTRKSTPGTARP